MNILTLLPLIIVVSGSFLLLKLKFFFIKRPINTLKELKRALSHKGAFKALCLSLAGTLGVGNIVGVAFGISVGGPGSVFWLFISSIFSLILKFSEATLASDMKNSSSGGMIHVIKASFSQPFKILAAVYAALCILLSLTMGSALQARAAIESLTDGTDILIPSIFFTVLVAIAIFGNTERIEKITAYLIPIATVIYMILTLAVIILNLERLPTVFVMILTDAFSLRAGVGGACGFLIISKMREGFSRGLLSNEAGAGTSALAHTRNDDSSAVSVGLVGMCEVIFDTVILCMLTAFAVLLAVPTPENYSSGIEIVKKALASLGDFSHPTLAACVFAFAYSTVICWFYYGKCALSYFTEKGKLFFSLIFILSVLFGALTPSGKLIIVSDYILFALTVISLFTVIKNSDRLVSLSENSGLITKGECVRERSEEP